MGNSSSSYNGYLRDETDEELISMMKLHTEGVKPKKIAHFITYSRDWYILKDTVAELCIRKKPFKGTQCLCP